MGATAIDSRHRCRCFLLLLFSLFPPHLGDWVGVLGVRVFYVHFWSIGVCVECVFFSKSNIVNYRKKIYIHLQIVTAKSPAQLW